MFVLCVPGAAITKDKADFSNLGSLYSKVAEKLSQQSEWQVKGGKKATGRFHLILGEAQASNISFKMLAGYDSLYPGLVPLCNFYRGFNILCRKTLMVKTLRRYFENLDDSSDSQRLSFEDMCPVSFLFFPAKKDQSEYEAFLTRATQMESERGNGDRVLWIVKPSDGCKGHNIRLFDNPQEVLSFVDSQSEGSIAWVVQKYIDRPILIPSGRRKFDIRVWVLLDASYNMFVYRRGAVRVAAKAYLGSESEMADLSDIHAHLSNHCIAETHSDYGKYEPTNELWYDDLEAILLQLTEGATSFSRDVLPRMHDIVRHSLLAVREQMQGADCGAYRSFNVFGYDFMLSRHRGVDGSECIKPWLIEINSSPAVAEDLLDEFAEDLISTAIAPVVSEGDDETSAALCGDRVSDKGADKSALFPRGFDLIYSAKEKFT